MQIISRGKGKTAVAAAAYRAGKEIRSQYDGRVCSYTRKGGIIYKEIILPENAPKEYKDRSTLWNSVEMAERYKTAQLAREIVIALPVELTQEQNISLAREYVKKVFVNSGMCADLCVHDDGSGNPHAHIMLTLRALDEQGKWKPKSFTDSKGRKVPVTNWSDHERAEEWRKAWADLQNEYLKKYHIDQTVDHRSFKRQGREEKPTIHLGNTCYRLKRRGFRTWRGDYNRDVEVTNNKLRQLNARIRKAKDELYTQTLIGALSLADVGERVLEWRNFNSHYDAYQRLQEVVNFHNFIRGNDLHNMSEVVERAEKMYDEIRDITKEVKKIDKRLDTLETHRAQYAIYKQYYSLAKECSKLTGKKQDAFYDQYRDQLDDFKSAKLYFDKIMNGKTKLPIKDWEREEKGLHKKRWELCDKYYDLRNEVKTVEQIRRSAEKLFDEIPVEQEFDQLDRRRSRDYTL